MCIRDSHMMADEPGGGSDEDVVREALDDDEVVRHEPVPALDEGESALAFADARLAEEERPEAADLEEGAVESRARRERLLEKRGEAFDDDARHARRHEERDAAPAAEARENRPRVDSLRDHDTGNRKRREGIEALASDARGKSLQEGKFALTEDLDAIRLHVGREARDREAGLLHARPVNGPLETLVSRDQPEAEGRKGGSLQVARVQRRLRSGLVLQ